MKIILTFCEGAHDAAFTYRILKVNQFRNFSDKIQKLPQLLKANFWSKFKEHPFMEEGKLNPKLDLPSFLLKKNETYNLIYSLGSVDNIEKSIPILNDFKALKDGTLDTDKIPIGVCFVLDAEKLMVETRIKKIREALSPALSLSNLKHNSVLSKGIEINAFAAYIFSNKSEKGKLEDILIPIMKKENETIFENAECFLKNNIDEAGIKKRKFDEQKSLISIVGQLQLSGRANTVIIHESDYITDKKIKENNTCKEILDLYKALEKEL